MFLVTCIGAHWLTNMRCHPLKATSVNIDPGAALISGIIVQYRCSHNSPNSLFTLKDVECKLGDIDSSAKMYFF